MALLILLPLAVLFLAAGPASAQFGLFGGPPPPPPPPGAGKSVADDICASQDLSTMCQLIRTAARDPTVAELLDPTFTGTVFVPDNTAFEDSQRRLKSSLGVASVADLQRSPANAAKVLANHIITGQAVQFAQLKKGQKYRAASGNTLTISEGVLYGKYVKGPTNTVRIHASAGQNDIPAARAVLHKVDGVIVPMK